MPAHPTLAAILAEWKLSAWAAMMGRQPTPDDLIVPMPPDAALRRRSDWTPEGMRNKSYCFKRFREGSRTPRLPPPPRARHAPHDGLPQPRGRRPKGHPRALHAQSEEDGLVDRRVHDVPVGGAVWRGREAQDPAAHARQHRRTARGCRGHGAARRRRLARAPSAGSASAIRRPQKSRTCGLACYTACYTGRGFQRNPRPFVVEAPGVEPGSGSALLKPLRACPAIWFSSSR